MADEQDPQSQAGESPEPQETQPQDPGAQEPGAQESGAQEAGRQPEETGDAEDAGTGGTDPSEAAAAALKAAQAAVSGAGETADAADAEDEAALNEAKASAEETASEAARVVGPGNTTTDGAAEKFEAPIFENAEPTNGRETMEMLGDVELHVAIELGRTRMYVEDVLKLGDGAVVELDKPAGDPVDVYVNGRHVARGEILVLNDNFCVRVSDLVDQATEQDRT